MALHAIEHALSQHEHIEPFMLAGTVKELLQMERQGKNRTKQNLKLLIGSQIVLANVTDWNQWIPWDDLKTLAKKTE